MKYQNALNDLYDTLESFANIDFVEKNRDEIIIKLKEHLDTMKLMDFFNRDLPVQLLNKYDLYYLLCGFKWFYEKYYKNIIFDNKLLLAEKYFDSREIDEITNTVIIPDIKPNETFELKNTIKLDDKQYIVGRIAAKDLVELVKNNFIKYDFKMQRESEKVVRNGVTFERIKIYKKSVKDIKESMKSNRYRATPISINILDRSDDINYADIDDFNSYYDEKSNTFTLSIKDRISIIDGMHRLYAILECCNEDSEFDQQMQLNIFFMTQKEARDYIFQEGQKNPISKEQLKKYDTYNIYSDIANKVVEEGNKTTNYLQGIIGLDKKDVELLHKFTTFDKFTDALKDNFNIDKKNVREQRLLRRFLNLFFNEVIGLFQNEFNNIAQVDKRLYTNSNAIYFYLKIASIIKERSDWEEDLFEILSNDEFTILLSNFFANTEDVFFMNKKHKNNIYESTALLVKKTLSL